jgi:hypothetical protein
MTDPSPAAVAAVDDLRLDEIERLADRAASYWRSAAEAAFRDDRNTLNVHCTQIALVTREAFRLVKALSAAGERAQPA